ncbi:MAG: hypothetical protein AB1331_09780 [Bacillota bacterium]
MQLAEWLAGADEGPEETLIRGELRELVTRELAALPVVYGSLLQIHYCGGKGGKTIG